MSSYTNWISNPRHLMWKHKNNLNVIVYVIPNRSYPELRSKYLIYHSHPGPNGHAILQEPEGAKTLANARKHAEKHLRHWNNPESWKTDPDYGKMGKRAT